MSRQSVKTRATHVLIERKTGGAALAPTFDAFVENAADEQGVISNVRSDQKRLIRRGILERQQKVREINAFKILHGRPHLPDLRKLLQQRGDIICQGPVIDA